MGKLTKIGRIDEMPAPTPHAEGMRSIATLTEVRGIDEVPALELYAEGIRATATLTDAGGGSQGSRALAQRTQISERTLRQAAYHADLRRVHGIGPQFANLLLDAGVKSVQALARRNPQNLLESLRAQNAKKKLVRRLPTAAEVSGWIEQARSMPRVASNGGGGRQPGARDQAGPSDGGAESHIVEVELPGESRITRFGRLDLPGQVPLQQLCTLAVTVNRQKIEGGAGQVELGLDALKWPIRVLATLKVRPEDFRVEGPGQGLIEVPRDADAQPLTFALVPLDLGAKTVRVKFEQNNTYLNTAFLTTQVVAADAAPGGAARVEGAPTITASAVPPDWTVYIDQEVDLSYTVSVRSRQDDAALPAQLVDRIHFDKPPDQFVDALFTTLDAKTKTGLSPQEFDAEVKKLGTYLFENLFHTQGHAATPDLPGFQTFFWDRLFPKRGSAVQIVSEEPWIPWEILRPTRQRADGTWESDPLYFCERFALSRWLEVSGPGPAGRLPMRHLVVVAPPSNLAYVHDEVQSLTTLPGIEPTTIEDKAALEQFFQSGPADIVHFACHGKFQQQSPERSVVLLGDKRLSPMDLTAENRNFARTQPLVFLNACDSGRLGLGLTGVDGWARAFLEAQAGSFVGSVWKTTDERACLLAATFYSQLRAGDTVAEALRQARDKVKTSGDATYLSYTLYANPQARAV